MKQSTLLLASILLSTIAFTQMDLPPSGGNPKAMVSEQVGITSITINYSRPDVNKREGKIYGEGSAFIVPYGFTGSSFITNKSMPWRAGANENTSISFEHDVMVEGKPLKAGTYGLHMALAADNIMLIFSNQSEAWGSFSYDDKYDALRVNVKPVALEKGVEWLKYEFIEHKEKYCVIAMQWEKLAVPFKVEVDVDNITLARLRDQVTSMKQFNSTNMIQASSWCFNKNINLDEALVWAQRAVTGFQGQRSYVSLRNLATGYEKLNRLPQADSVMNDALAMANANQTVAYGRALITQKRIDKSLEIMKAAKTKFGDVLAVNNGMSFVYSAKGDFKKALEYAEKALTLAPEPQKAVITANIAKLKEGKDINQ